jgi:prevent-host-death family protein
MAKEKVMPFVEARARLSEIVDRVAEHGDTYVVAKRQKPVAVIMGSIDTGNYQGSLNM